MYVLLRIGCVGGCDDVLKELTELSRFGGHNQTATPGMDACPYSLFHTWDDCCAHLLQSDIKCIVPGFE
jgi:hypothetical protein